MAVEFLISYAGLLKRMISSDHFTALRAISAYVGCLRIDSTLLSLLDVFCDLFRSSQFSTNAEVFDHAKIGLRNRIVMYRNSVVIINDVCTTEIWFFELYAFIILTSTLVLGVCKACVSILVDSDSDR